jgi:class 3 adenylate cyclase
MAEERLQRRLAAILSADMVGCSRLMGIDEAGTLSGLNALRRDVIDPKIAVRAPGAFERRGGGVGESDDPVDCGDMGLRAVRMRVALQSCI